MKTPEIGLQLQGVGKAFGTVRVVQELDLEVAQGEFVVLLGESGCGKSTTLRMIAGLDEVSEGRIFIKGRDVTDLPPKARDIAMVFQNYALYPHMDVAHNMSFALELAGASPAEIERRVKEAAAVLNITHLLQRKPKELSGGQRQRVAIGRCIVREPAIFPLRRAAVQPGRQAARPHAHRTRAAARTPGQDHGVRDARPGRGDDAGLAHRDLRQGAHPAGGRAFGSLQPAGQPVRRGFHRHAQHEPAGRPGGGAGRPWRVARAGLCLPAAQCALLQGQALVAGVRPQTLRLAAGGGTAMLQLQVDVVEYLGMESLLVGKLVGAGEGRVTAVVPGQRADLMRQTVGLDLDPQALHVFDKASGRRINV
jgi:ABC-type sugar transport system ATPase subunit